MNIFIKSIRRLMGWCPLKGSLRKGRQEGFFSGFKSENGLVPSSTGLQAGRVLKAQIILFPDIWDVPIILFASTVVFMIWASTYDSFMLLSGFYLFFIPFLFLKYLPSTVAVTPEKIIIKRPMRKPVVIQREDIMQISVIENKSYSLRWSFRLIYVGLTLLIVFLVIDRQGINLQKLVMYMPLLLVCYGFEILKPYQCVLKIITRSSLRLWPQATLSLWLSTEESEEITRMLKKESE